MKWNLNQDWRFRVGDAPEVTKLSHTQAYQFSQAGSIWGIGGVNYDDSDWEVVQLPHDYMVKTGFDPEEVRNHGYRKPQKGWYRKRFCLPEEVCGKHLMLVFYGIAMQAKIYLNGSLLARSYTAYTPVELDITDRAYFGERVNTLVVEVDGFPLEGWFYEGNGIYRDVVLLVKEKLHLTEGGCYLHPVLEDDGWKLEFEAEVENSAYDDERTEDCCRVRVEVYDGERLMACGESGIGACPHDQKLLLTGAFAVDSPKLWSPDQPKLYDARVTLLQGNQTVDEQRHRIGFRSFSVDAGKGFFLNGAPIKLKGSCNHQDHAGIGVAVPDAIFGYRLKLLKELGCNTHRNAHNMATESFLSLCDELGMMVIDETRHFESDAESLKQVSQMVKAARNHPSVVLYSLYNEEALQATREGKNIFRRMRNRVRELDQDRLITAAMGGGVLDENGTATLMDVTGINYSLAIAEEFHKRHPDQPVFGSENCSVVATRGHDRHDAKRNICADGDCDVVDWGQLLRDTWDFARSRDWYGGINIWTGFDYRGEPSPFDWPSVSSFFGLYDSCGFPKDNAYLVKGFFSDAPVVHLFGDWNHAAGEVISVKASSNCEQVELFINGVSFGRRAGDCVVIREWTVLFAAGECKAVGYKDGVAVCEDILRTAGKAAGFLIEPQKEMLLADGRDAVCVNITVLDKNGVAVPDANLPVRIAVEGARLLGVGNGDPNAHLCEQGPEYPAFCGKLQAVIGSVVGMTAASVSVKADGLEDAAVKIPVTLGEMPAYLPSERLRTVHGVQVTVNTYQQRPQIGMEFADFDMNSLEHMVLDSYSYKPGFREGWKLYRVAVTAPKVMQGETVTVTLQRVRGAHIVIEADGKILLDRAHKEGPVSVSIESAPGEVHEIRMLLQGNGDLCGIYGNIMIDV